MEINLKIHNIIFTVAPSGAGKSHFCKNVLLKQIKEKYPLLNVQYLSSDDTRRELLNDSDRHKYDSEMGVVSAEAFDLIDKKLDLLTSFPINAEIIVVDSTGLSNAFREKLINLAKDKNYNITPFVFDFTDRKDYFKWQDFGGSITAKHLKTFKLNTLKEMKKSYYTDIIRIKDTSLDFDVKIDDYEYYRSHFLPEDKKYVVIGDLHGCINEFKDVIRVSGSDINEDDEIVGDKIYIVQDFIDKGYAIKDTIEFIYKNVKIGKIVPLLGNHENYVYKAVTGQIKRDSNLEESYFNTVPLLCDNDISLKEKFLYIVECSRQFYSHKNFFVNHAPCRKKYLGKIDSKSLKNQRNFTYPKRAESETIEEFSAKLEEALSFIKEDYTNHNSKKVYWGHVALVNTRTVGNVTLIDTGCVYSNKLAYVFLDGKHKVKVLKLEGSLDEELPNIFFERETVDVDLSQLDIDDFNRIKFLALNKVNFISGTMCPADKDEETMVLEDLRKGLEYYKDTVKIDKVVLQRKYMGSSAQIYLHRDIDKCYATSRNGYKIDRHQDLTKIYEDLLNKHLDWMDFNEYDMIILNGELMPWRLLGDNLIENQYTPVLKGLESELELLKTTGYFDTINKTVNHPRIGEFIKDDETFSKKELIAKYGQRDYEQIKNIIKLAPELIGEEDYENGIKVFSEELNRFGAEGETHFLPFSILKGIMRDGNEYVYKNNSNLEVFNKFSEDSAVVINFDNENWFEDAEAFFNEVTKDECLEGIVIKPYKIYTKYVAPAIKVRNPRYLTLIYSYDYKKKNKYDKLIERKNIRHKLSSSVKEFEIGMQMLDIPYDKISLDNQDYVNLCAKMILDEKKVKADDPRL